MSNFLCVVCLQTATDVRSVPKKDNKRREWFIRLNLIDEELDDLEKRVQEKFKAKKKVWICYRHFDNKEAALPIDRREKTDTPRLQREDRPQNVRVEEEQPCEDSVGSVGDDIYDFQLDAPSSQGTDYLFAPSQGTCSQETDNGVLTDSPTTIDDHKFFLVSKESLMSLFSRCRDCGTAQIEAGTFHSWTVGSALNLQWVCLVCDRIVRWSSQEKIEGYYEGNLKFTTSVHITGTPVPKVLAMGKELGLALPSYSTMRNHVADVIIPAVDVVYETHKKQAEATVRGASGKHGIDVAVDGRYGTRGFTSTNNTNTVIDLGTNLVLEAVNMHKNMRGIDGVSTRMEKEGIKRGLTTLIKKMFTIRSVTSDNDAKIGKMMRSEPLFSRIRHCLDFWHLIKGINSDLRELSKKKKCALIKYWWKHIVNHCYHVHYQYRRNRSKGLERWKSLLAHVCGRHKHLEKVPFLSGISGCVHKELPEAPSHNIDRKSEEFRQLKKVILKPTFLAGFVRASPKKNTSPCESFNSLVNLYIPKDIACCPAFYHEKIKLVVLHHNTIAMADLTALREEKSSYVTRVKGRQTVCVKRKMSAVDHYWRREVWKEVQEVARQRKLHAYLKKIGAPDSIAYVKALYGKENDQQEGDMVEDGAESDVSVELGGGYGEEVDSDSNPIMDPIVFSDDHDSESDHERGETREEVLSSGSEWNEGEEEESKTPAGRGRGRSEQGKARGGTRGKGRAAKVAEEGETSEEEGEGEAGEVKQPEKPKRVRKTKRGRGEEADGEEEGYEGDGNEPVKRVRGKKSD